MKAYLNTECTWSNYSQTCHQIGTEVDIIGMISPSGVNSRFIIVIPELLDNNMRTLSNKELTFEEPNNDKCNT